MNYDFTWFSIFIALNGIILLGLGLNVSRLRVKHKISIGDGGNKQLMQAIRSHGNGVEQVTIFGLLLLALIFTGVASGALALLVLVFTVSRGFHAYGMNCRSFIARRAGAGITFLMQGVAIISLLVALAID